ncbi:MAG TPA: FAD-dependent oxidoreductase [Polyangiaceae bacterium]|nr:FAD-dependent oxidoreductase [Polyangiaceae bacterium]
MRKNVVLAASLLALAVAAGFFVKRHAAAPTSRVTPAASQNALTEPPDAIVVGAGIAGLSAAYELAKGGARVTIIDTASVFGGHAVMATGDLCLVATPFQEAQGIKDSPDLAYQDFMKWGEDANPEWVRYYVDHSRPEVYDWLTSLGVSFETLVLPAGNSVKRTHRTKGRGIGLVSPIFAECARRPNVSFQWNTRAERLLVEGGRIAGVAARNVRSQANVELHARVVVLATGGFQSNLDMVRASWSGDLPFPEHFLIGSGINSTGTGHGLAKSAGAELTRLDHQWNYITGLPDPRFADGSRGLNAVNPDSIWVNSDAKRFIAEKSSPKLGFPKLVSQKGATYWSIFDEGTKHSFWVAGSDWSSFDTIERLIFADPKLVKTAASLDELAAKAGLPAKELKATVEHYNQMVDKGVDDEFQRFGPGKDFKPKKVLKAPYYAVQFFPLTRKSMGGVAIDTQARVLDANKRPIAGLYAAGELTGLGGLNGKAALEGTFLAPSIVTGRVAGRAALLEIGAKSAPPILPLETPVQVPQSKETCLACHQLPTLVAQPRAGYWHFEKVHSVVLDKQFECSKCHSELGSTFDLARHHIDRLAQPRVCTTCHSGEDR